MILAEVPKLFTCQQYLREIQVIHQKSAEFRLAERKCVVLDLFGGKIDGSEE
jgi:hypothetical protein